MTNGKWIYPSIVIGSAMFVLGLTVSAIFAPQWRVLHAFQALIYVAVVVLTRRQNVWGYGMGVLMAVFWNILILFGSPFVHEAMQTGLQPEVVVHLIALGGHFLIIIGCLAGFLRTRPAGRQWGAFSAGGLLAIGYLMVLVFTIGPPEGVENIKRAFGV